MKKLLLSILFFSSAILSFSFGKKGSATVTGYINYYGNAPFAFPGIETDDNLKYAIQVEEGSSFTVKDIGKLQGNHLMLSGRIEKEDADSSPSLRDGIFIVSRYKVIK